MTAVDLVTFSCTDLIQSEASWKLSSTSDWLMSALKNVSSLKKVTLFSPCCKVIFTKPKSNQLHEVGTPITLPGCVAGFHLH